MPAQNSDRGLELYLLGGFEARLDGARLEGISYNKMRALLAYLAIEQGRDHSRETLAAMFWSEADSETARGNLRRTLADLRKAMEQPASRTLFTTNKHSMRLNAGFRVDALEFSVAAESFLSAPARSKASARIRQMERAAELYRGDFLLEFSLSECPEFDAWLQRRRDALRRQVQSMLEKLSDHHAQAGDAGKALRFALRRADLDPWNENALRQIMRLHAQNGHPELALSRYEGFAQSMRKELDAVPADESRRLFERIRGEAAGGGASPVRIAPPAHRTSAEIERRQLTVLSFELTVPGIDDPDEVIEVLQEPQARCLNIIDGFSGHVVTSHGGALLAYFGYPKANEGAARHAVDAALALLGEAGEGIEIRAGIHTGLIVTGRDASSPDTSGRTTGIAIEMRNALAPNQIALSHDTYRMVAGYFDCESLGVRSLRRGGQQEIFQVREASGARTRLDALSRMTPLAGRKAEIAQLLELWKVAAQGRSTVVLVEGEAGIGKSRLLHALKDKLADTEHSVRELRCFPESSQSPFYPLIAMLEALFGFARGDTQEAKARKLSDYLESNHAASAWEAVPLLAQLFSLPLPGAYRPTGYSPQKQKDQTVALLLGMLRNLSAQRPVLLIVEDLHWIDPSTLEMLDLFVRQPGPAPILAVLTARPEFDPPWGKEFETSIAMPPLAKAEVEEMLASIGGDIPSSTLRGIAERADGVPLFVEEMVKVAGGGHSSASAQGVPATLRDLLATRMDSLGEARHTAQLAAIIGREFDLHLLQKLAPDPAALKSDLRALQDAGLIFEVDESTRQFKHALLQEAAYQSQAKTARQAAHRRIAQILRDEFQEVAANRPELIAQHLLEGGQSLESVHYWTRAGQRAALNSANAEAREHFDRGLRLLLGLPPGEERDRTEATLQLDLGTLLIATRGYGSAEAGAAYWRALALCEKLGDQARLYQALWGMWLTSSSRVGHAHSLELAGQLLHHATGAGQRLHLQSAHHAMGNSSLMTGNLQAARKHLEKSMALFQIRDHDAMVLQYGENICVSSGSLLSWVLWLQGTPAQAHAASRKAIALARRLNHPNSLGYALCAAAILNRWEARVEATSALALEALALAQSHGLPFWLGLGAASHGWARSMGGEAEGAGQIQQCLEAVNAVMSGAAILFLAPLCEALIRVGRLDEALEKLDEALSIIAANDDRFFESEFHRQKGDCLLALSASNAAEAADCYEKALKVSRAQGAKMLEKRTLGRLAVLRGRQPGKKAVSPA